MAGLVVGLMAGCSPKEKTKEDFLKEYGACRILPSFPQMEGCMMSKGYMFERDMNWFRHENGGLFSPP